jgi:ribonuclease P protein component
MAALANVLGHCRIAFAIGRKAHGNAVKRNRVRRLCREGFRRVQDQMPAGIDFVYIPRSGDCHSVDVFAESLLALARRVADKLERDKSSKPNGGGTS